jgi:hypothetical protein
MCLTRFSRLVRSSTCMQKALIETYSPPLDQWDTLCPAYDQFIGLNATSDRVENGASKTKGHSRT